MSHSHEHRGTNRRRLATVLVLVCAYMVAEIAGGLWTHSLALLADAGHMASDAAALALSLFAIWIAERPPNARRTYGYYRMEILAALANGAALVAVAVLILFEAYGRLREPPQVQGIAMIVVAVGGLVVNLLSLSVLGGGCEENLNVHGAWLHVLSDTLGSVGAILAGILIAAFGWNLADPLISALIAALIVYSSWRLLAESVSVLMESAPRSIDVDRVRDALSGVSGVRSVHDLHVWCITSGMDSLSAHLVIEDGPTHIEILTEARHLLATQFGVHHVTLQIEPLEFNGHAECPMGTHG